MTVFFYAQKQVFQSEEEQEESFEKGQKLEERRNNMRNLELESRYSGIIKATFGCVHQSRTLIPIYKNQKHLDITKQLGQISHIGGNKK